MLSFGHLLPESVAVMASQQLDSNGAKVLMHAVFGFLSMLFIEKVAFVEDKSTEDANYQQLATSLVIHPVLSSRNTNSNSFDASNPVIK